MKWTAIYSEQAETDLDLMPADLAKKVILKVDEIEKDPFAHLQKIRNFPLYKFKVENYRGIVTLANRKLFINIVKIKHRNVVYRDLKT